MIGIIKNANNPQAMLSTMAKNNPQIKQTIDYINKNGGNAQQLFYSLAKQNGIDPNEILEMLK